MPKGEGSRQTKCRRIWPYVFTAVAAVLVLCFVTFALLIRNGGSAIQAERFSASDLFRPCDILLLGSATWRGRIVEWKSRTTFGHVALVDVGDEGVFLIHASPQAGGVIRESIASYFGSNRIGNAALFRVDASPEQCDMAMRFARDAAESGISFNHSFRYGEGDGMYCTELILRAWEAGGIKLLGDLTKGEIVCPSALAGSSACRKIAEWSADDAEKPNPRSSGQFVRRLPRRAIASSTLARELKALMRM